MLAINIKEHGYSIEYLERLILMMRSSNGCRRTSSVCLLNSGSLSQKRTPLCARLISPGIGLEPPPTNATTQIYDFGEGFIKRNQTKYHFINMLYLGSGHTLNYINNASANMNNT